MVAITKLIRPPNRFVGWVTNEGKGLKTHVEQKMLDDAIYSYKSREGRLAVLNDAVRAEKAKANLSHE
jgi:hypothetical protein